MTDTPELENREVLNQVFVDATPDGNYALRLLTAYRSRCDVRWQTHGLDEDRAAIYKQMNEDQSRRGYELDEAILILLKARGLT